MTDLCRLTLVLPDSLEDEVVDSLLALTPPIEGFTSFNAEGHGHDFTHARTRERVRGRTERRVLWLVLSRDRAATVIEHLHKAIRSPEVAWWIEPVEQMGRLS